MSLRASKFLFNEAILLAGASIFGTALAHIREAMFAEQFGIPSELIQIELSSCIWATLVVVAGSSPLALSIWYSWSDNLYKEAGGVAFAMLIIGVCFGQWWTFVLWILAIAGTAGAALIVLLYFGRPLFEAIDEAFFRRLKGFQRFGGIVVVVLFALAVAGGAGFIDAENCRAKFVLTERSSMCLVRRYGSQMVFVSFDESTGEVLSDVEIWHVSDAAPLQLRRVQNPVRLVPANP